MKNPTILKDELSFLRADRSAVITELRNGSKRIKEITQEILKLESKKEGVKSEILEETARLDDIRDRAVSVKSELSVSSQELKNIQNTLDLSKLKNSQEIKLHLGRIKELEERENETIVEIGRLKNLFDKNSKVYNELESSRLVNQRNLDAQIIESEAVLNVITKQLESKSAEEKKMTKDRLKREDKLRGREKHLDARESSLGKWEEDLITMSKDMSIIYGRLKELYSKEKPGVDLDKLILKAI